MRLFIASGETGYPSWPLKSTAASASSTVISRIVMAASIASVVRLPHGQLFSRSIAAHPRSLVRAVDCKCSIELHSATGGVRDAAQNSRRTHRVRVHDEKARERWVDLAERCLFSPGQHPD